MGKGLEAVRGRNAGSQVGPGMPQGTGCLASSSALFLVSTHLTSQDLCHFVHLLASVFFIRVILLTLPWLYLRVKAKVKSG